MSVLVNSSTRVLIQGITGKEGNFQAQRCIDYGTKVAAGGLALTLLGFAAGIRSKR